MQPHDAALRVLRERIALDQALRVDQAARDRAGLLARRRCRRQRAVAPDAPVLALGAEPGRQVGKIVEVEIAEQLGAAGVLVDADLFQRRAEVVLDPGRQAHQRAAAHQRDAGFAAQAEQPLAQAGVGLPGGDRGPQQRREVIALDRPGQGDDREQRRVFRPDGDPARTVARDELGSAEQAQLPRRSGLATRAACGRDGAGHAAQCGVLPGGRQLSVARRADLEARIVPRRRYRRVTAIARHALLAARPVVKSIAPV